MLKMKKFKLEIVQMLESFTKTNKEINLHEICKSKGINHLKTQEVHDIIKIFTNRNKDYKPVQMMIPHLKNQSLFTTLSFITDNLY
jgi:Glu-tRNA(Gln) amidotransferase subunit E-like FAD-binding protein